MKRKYSIILLAILAVGCTSRLRMDLFLTVDDNRRKVKVESTEYIPGATFGNPMGQTKVHPGEGNVVSVLTSTRGKRGKTGPENVLSFDETLRSRLYIQLPPVIQAGSIALDGNTFVQMLGRYDWTAASKIFLPVSGNLMIDSVTSKYLFISVNTRYLNDRQLPFEYDGRLKIKIID